MTERADGLRHAWSATRLRRRHGIHRACAGARFPRGRATAEALVSVHDERYERLHRPGHLRRVHVLAERLQDMHDANFTGEKASQSQVHAWFVLDRDYCGPATISPVSINAPDARMPWVNHRRGDNGYHPAPRGTSRGYVLARAAREGRADLAELVDSGALSARAALRELLVLCCVVTARPPRRRSKPPAATRQGRSCDGPGDPSAPGARVMRTDLRSPKAHQGHPSRHPRGGVGLRVLPRPLQHGRVERPARRRTGLPARRRPTRSARHNSNKGE